MKESREYVTDRDFMDRKKLKDTFIDRLSLISEIESLLHQEPPLPVVVLFGVGGVGKTFLLHYIKEKYGRGWQESPEGYPHANVSLRTAHTGLHVVDVLESMENQIRIYWPQFTFPRFDFVLEKFCERIHRSSRANHSRIGKELELLGEIGLNKIYKVGKLIGLLVGKIDRLRTHREIRPWFIDNLEKPFGVPYKDAVNQISLGEIQRLLPKAFAADLAQIVKGLSSPFDRVILIVDNYELLEVGTQEIAGKKLPSFVQQLAEEIIRQRTGILVIIAGKDKLHWAEVRLQDGTRAVDENNLWANGVTENSPAAFSSSNLIQRLLGNLSKEDSFEYLRKRNLSDLRLIDNIYELTAGYPLGLSTAADLITHASDKSSEELSILREKTHNFPPLSVEWKEELCGWILERLLEQLKDQNREPLRALVRIASIPRWFDVNLLFSLTRMSEIQDQFYQLVDFSFVEPFEIKLPPKTLRAYRLRSDIRRFLHKTFRIQQQLRELNVRARNYFGKLMETAQSPEERFLYELEFMYHFATAEPEHGFHQLELVFESYLEGHRINFCESILEVLKEIEDLPPYMKAKIYLMTGLLYTVMAEYDIACENLHEAYLLEPLTKGFAPYRIAIVQSLAECCRLMGRNLEALRYWGDILELANERNEPCSKFLAVWGQSLTYKLIDEVPLAYQQCDEAGRLLKTINDQGLIKVCREFGLLGYETKEANILRHKAELSRCLGDYENAYICLDKFKSVLGENTSSLSYAYGLLVLAHLSRMEGDVDQARALATHAKRIFDYNHEPRGIYSALRALGQIALYDRKHDVARAYFEEVLNASSRYYPYGPIYAHLGLGELDRLSGRLSFAEEHYKAAATLCRQLGGKIETAYAYLGLAEIARIRQDIELLQSCAKEALQIGSSSQNPWVLVYANLILCVAVRQDNETFLEKAVNANRLFKRRSIEIDIEEKEISRTKSQLSAGDEIDSFRFNFL